MKEVKTPKKPLAIYYAIVLLVLMLLNFVLVPWMSERQVKEVDYGTFMSMTEDKDIGRVMWNRTRSSLPIKTKSKFTRPA